MPDYDFTSLSSYDFEGLVRDLLQEELGITLESFKPGKDGGTDLRYSSSNEDTIIIQCKHYVSSGYSKLYSALKNNERKKVRKLSPPRYILSTSVGLTPDNKEKIKHLFTPYCLSTSDIYGKDDLNNLLGKYPEVEKRNFKLWLTSQSVLDRILHSAIFNRSEFELEHIKNKLQVYVQNQSYFEAKKILEDLHYCIISGIPGIGKTTLAEILLVDYLSHGYDIIKISADIEEAFATYGKSKKQVFYYDDFLGQTALADKFNKNEEQRLLQFINTIKKTGNARFILTTREYILNQAKITYERLSNSGFDYRKCVIDLSRYTKFNRAEILFNHAYFSNLSENEKSELVQDKNYLKIIEHPNYNPRIIEWMTDYTKFSQGNGQTYIGLFLSNLDNPSKLWNHAFLNQISNSSRHLLIVLASLPDEVLINDLEVAFNSFHTHQTQTYRQNSTSLDFKRSLDELESNFIKIERTKANLIVKFHNPSIRDFLDIYLYENKSEAKSLCMSVKFFEQCEKLWETNTHSQRVRRNHLNTTKKTPATGVAKNFPDDYWEALRNTFESKSVRLVNIQKQNSQSTYKGRSTTSLEARVIFSLETARTLSTSETTNIIQQMVKIVLKRLDQGFGSKWNLSRFLNYVDEIESNYRIPRNQVIIRSKRFFFDELTYFDAYDSLIRFRRQFPEHVSKDEYQQIINEFDDFYYEEVECIIDNVYTPDEIYNEIDLLQTIAQEFNIDVNDGVERLQEFESKLSDEISYKEDMEANFLEDDWKEARWEEQELEEEIVSLFETLV